MILCILGSLIVYLGPFEVVDVEFHHDYGPRASWRAEARQVNHIPTGHNNALSTWWKKCRRSYCHLGHSGYAKQFSSEHSAEKRKFYNKNPL